VRAREEERRRLRRDLHDGLGPALAALTLRVDALRNRCADPALDLDAELVNLRDGIQDAIVDVRRVIEGLRPPALDEVGIAVALEQLAASFESPDGLVVDVHVVTLPTLPAAVESALYRVAQEALTNVVRHARAAQARLTVTVKGDQVCLEVIDDGTGHVLAHTAGVGLTSMRERVEEISGSFRIAGRPGLGTTVRALFPLETPRGERA
jgi:signal transduction histidine kinase